MIVITFTSNPTEWISGIPIRVAITTSIASTIYYTLDGTLPTPFSSVYTGTVLMPTDGTEVTLSAIAYYLDELGNLVPSAVLSESYYTDQTQLDRHRLMFFEGVVYIFPGGEGIPFYYDGDGDLATSIDIPAADLDFVESTRDVNGLAIDTATQISILPPDQTAQLFDNTPPAFSSPNDRASFNPEARLIFIDGRTGAAEQQIRLVNGPHMSLRNSQGNYGGIDFYNTSGSNYISGTSVRPIINREKGIMIFQYFDSNTSKWIKSVQSIEAAPVQEPMPVTGGPGVVLPWIQLGRRQSV